MAAGGIEMVRYADDFVLLCHSEAAAQRALGLVQQSTAAAGLTLHPEKTRIVDVTQRGGGLSGMTKIRRAAMFSTYAIMALSPRKPRNVSSTITCSRPTSGDLMMCMSWMERLTVAGVCG